MATTIQWDYSVEDAKDDTGVDDNNIVDSAMKKKFGNTSTISRRRVWVAVGLTLRWHLYANLLIFRYESSLLSPVPMVDDLLMFLRNIRYERLHKSFTKLRRIRLSGSIATPC